MAERTYEKADLNVFWDSAASTQHPLDGEAVQQLSMLWSARPQKL